MINEVTRLLENNNELCFFLGAGVSIGQKVNNKRVGLGTGFELAEHLIQHFKLNNPEPKTLINVCDECSFTNEGELRKELHDYLGKGVIQNTHKLLVEIIHDLGLPKDFLLTVNVDDLLEQAFQMEKGTRLPTAKRTEDLFTGGDKVYLKLHGCVSEIDKAVFTTKDYLNIDKDNRLYDKIQSIFAERSIVFIGFSIQDLDVLKMLYKVRPSNGFMKPHFWVVPKGNSWSASRERFYLREFNINHIDLNAEDFLQHVNDHIKKNSIVKP